MLLRLYIHADHLEILFLYTLHWPKAGPEVLHFQKACSYTNAAELALRREWYSTKDLQQKGIYIPNSSLNSRIVGPRCCFQVMFRVSMCYEVQDPPKINLICAMSFFPLSGQKPIFPNTRANIQKKNNSFFLGEGDADKLFNLAFD